MSDAVLNRILLEPKDGKLRWKCESCGAIVACEEKWAGEVSACPSCRKSVTYPTRAEVDGFLERNRFRFRIELGVSLVTAAIYGLGVNLPGVGSFLLSGFLGWFAAAFLPFQGMGRGRRGQRRLRDVPFNEIQRNRTSGCRRRAAAALLRSHLPEEGGQGWPVIEAAIRFVEPLITLISQIVPEAGDGPGSPPFGGGKEQGVDAATAFL